MIGIGSHEAPAGRRALSGPYTALRQDRQGARERVETFPRSSLPQRTSRASGDASPQAAAMLEFLPCAALLIDRSLRVVQANRAAEALLQESGGLFAPHGEDGLRLAATFGAEARALRAMLTVACLGEGGRGERSGALRVSSASGRRTFMIIAAPLPTATFPLWAAAGQDAGALVRILDPQASAARQADVLRRATGMTAAEGRVLALVAEGLATPKVAELLDVSPNTVRTHLARCFDKAGVRSQAALVRLVASVAGGGADV